jgi:2-hydroxychromene-2-carboxylate isomerase
MQSREFSPADLLAMPRRWGWTPTECEPNSTRAHTTSEWPRNVASADASGVAGTPTFFVHGKRHHGDYDPDTLSAAVRAAQTRAAARSPRKAAANE